MTVYLSENDLKIGMVLSDSMEEWDDLTITKIQLSPKSKNILIEGFYSNNQQAILSITPEKKCRWGIKSRP